MQPIVAPVQPRPGTLHRERPHAREVAFPRVMGERAQRIKRAVDVLCAVGLTIAAFPLILLISLAVLLSSRGPVFFAHTRLGRRGRPFRVWKFRTMYTDSERMLEKYLDSHPQIAREWELNHKLKYDPRVTPVGRLLRRTSLDELPQIWNILNGDMSMVGPRPIVAGEIGKYGPSFVLYSQVKPGLTGLWQVSGRNNTSYRRRVELDAEYIRTWTVARDLSIVMKTFRAVLTGKGAY